MKNLDRIKEILRKIISYKYTPFICLFFIMLFFHTRFNLDFRDDIWFEEKSTGSFFEFLSTRYEEWTGRLIIEAIMILIHRLPDFVWWISNSFMYVLLAFNIYYLIGKKNIYWIILTLLLYPIFLLGEAGFIATTLNYLWPLALGLIAFYPIRHIYDGKVEKVWTYPIYILSLLFACNQEQMCAIIVSFYFIFIIDLFRKKKITKFIIISFIISLASLIFVLTCPGNSLRNIAEVERWYPVYKSFTIIDKVYLGVVTTSLMTVVNKFLPFIFLSILLPIIHFRKKSSNFIKAVSLIPIVLLAIYNNFLGIVSTYFSGFYELIRGAKYFLEGRPTIDYNEVSTLFSITVSILLIGSLLISIYKVFEKDKEKYLIPLILLAGFASRFILGFSPTIFASGLRTFFIFEISLIIISVYLIDKLDSEKTKFLLKFGLIIFSLMQLINLYILTI